MRNYSYNPSARERAENYLDRRTETVALCANINRKDRKNCKLIRRYSHD